MNRSPARCAADLRRGSGWLACFLLAYLSSFCLSGSSAPVADLDQSYQAVLEYARLHDLQFGRDLVFTYGPLGFLSTTVSQGLFPVQRMLFALAWSAMVAWSATGLARQIPGRARFLFLAWFLIYCNFGTVEEQAFLVLIYGSIILMGEAHRHKAAAAAFLLVFALLALVKFNLLLAMTVGVALSALVQFCRRNVTTALLVAGSFVALFLAVWLGLGQHLANLPSWIRGSSEIAGGYTDAMTIFPKLGVLGLCVLAGVLYLAALLVIARSSQLSSKGAGVLSVTTVCLFLSWKHAFVRADGHVMDFIFFLPVAFAVLVNGMFQNSMGRRARLCVVAFFGAALILGNWAADLQEPGTMLTKLFDWPHHLAGNARLISKALTGDSEGSFQALRAGERQRRAPDLPVTRALVGGASVDVVNYRQWAALANGLNYRPRPVIQGYSAYTPYLQELNLSWYRSENRPRYLLCSMETIDRRFPALDDAPLLAYVIDNYRPVAADKGYLVLQAAPHGSPGAARTSLIREETVGFGRPFVLPADTRSTLTMQVEVRPTLFGRAVKFLFQAPVLTMEVTSRGTTAEYRFIPAMAERGFVISPILLNNDDLMLYFKGGPGRRASSISFARPGSSWGQLSDSIRVRLYAADD